MYTPDDNLLDAAALSERLRISARMARRLIEERRIRTVKVGRWVRVPESAIREFLENHTRPARGEIR